MPERMFPLVESERPDRVTAGEAAALAVCRACPVLISCREAVLTAAPLGSGLAGELTAAQRRAVLASRRGLSTVALGVANGAGT